MAIKTHLILGMFLNAIICPPLLGWSWNSADNALPSLREDLDTEIKAYRQKVQNGLSLQDRMIQLQRIISSFKPLGLNVVELETELARLDLQDQQQKLRSVEAQDEASALYDRGVVEYRKGQYQTALETFSKAERLLPEDDAIRELSRKLAGLTPIIESEVSEQFEGRILRLAITRYLENDPKRALNALVYAREKRVERPEIVRLERLVQKNHPEVDATKLSDGINLIDYKLQATLEAIYDGRYLTAIAECTDVLDLEEDNVLALTRLGSAYYAMNERNKAQKIWTRALQLDPENKILKKFLYSTIKRGPRVEAAR